MDSPYKKLEGCGQVGGRDVIKLLDSNDQPVANLPHDHPAYAALKAYLPAPNDQRYLFVVRYAPRIDNIEDGHIKLALAGQWQTETIQALEALEFKSKEGHPKNPVVPLVSIRPIDFRVPGGPWTAYGQVEFDWLEKLQKYYSTVKFRNTQTGERVAAYWCWP